ncbi:MAG: hypothetical protein WCB05_08620 [Candidatus Sulfotelmatobacter sp.]
MNRKRLLAIFSLSFVLIIVFSAAGRAQDHRKSYPTMAPIDQYLMTDRNAEIALARSAAPEAISRDATILVLERHGYQTAVEGKNGFVCAVERAWMGPFDGAEFWNPRVRGPLCFNPPAARSVLPITYKRTEMILAGKSKAQTIDALRAAYQKKELPVLEPGGMCYMMSKEAYLTDSDGHNMAHLMFYTPLMDGAVWGADVPNSPVMFNPQFNGAPEPIVVFMIPTGRWSDGTAAPLM